MQYPAMALASATGSDVRVYHELDETLFAASSASFIGSVYTELGAVNIADEADAEGTGYPQLTEEAVVEANPQLIVISDQAAYTAEDVAAAVALGGESMTLRMPAMLSCGSSGADEPPMRVCTQPGWSERTAMPRSFAFCSARPLASMFCAALLVR